MRRIHEASAEAKLVTASGVILLTTAAPLAAWEFYLALGISLAALAVRERVSVRRLAWFSPFLLGLIGAALLQPSGWLVCVRVAVKGTLCLLTVLVLERTTPFTELLGVLKRIGVPSLFVTTLALLHRYLAVLAEETERMKRARQARTFRSGRQWRESAGMLGQLFVRSTERAERIYAAMCARGWR